MMREWPMPWFLILYAPHVKAVAPHVGLEPQPGRPGGPVGLLFLIGYPFGRPIILLLLPVMPSGVARWWR
jgi:hypothetical protein